MKQTSRERIQALLKGGSSIPELAEFKDHARDVLKIGGIYGLDCWIDARTRLGLITDKAVIRAADILSNATVQVIYERVKVREKVSPLTVEQKSRLILERENRRRNPQRHHLHQAKNSEARNNSRSGQPRIDSSGVRGRSSE